MSSKLSVSIPKKAVVCGAHTEVGKFVIRELVRSSQIDLVYALAQVDCRDDIHVRAHEEPKLKFFVFDLDYIERALERFVGVAHIAFCCLGSSKNDFSAMGPYAYHKINFDIPRRFIRQVFSMEVQRVGVLSQAGADSKSKVEYLRVKGELVDFIAQLQADIGHSAPGVSMFKPPLLLTDMRDQNGVKGTAISAFDRIKQSAALKLEMGPARAVHVRDVAKAMVAETLQSADRGAENELTYMFRKEKSNITVLSGPEIAELAEDTRALQRSAYQRQLHSQSEQSARIRVSQYARDEGGYTDFDAGEEGVGLTTEERSYGTSHQFEAMSHLDSPFGDDNGTPPPSRDSEGMQGATHYDFEHDEYEHYSEARYGGARDYREEDEGNQYATPEKPIGSVESLGQQLGRSLTRINDNGLLPDVEHRLPRRRSRTKSPRPTPPDIQNPGGRSSGSPGWNETNYDLYNDDGNISDDARRLTGSTGHTFRSNSNAIEPPLSRGLGESAPISGEYSFHMDTPILDMQTPSPIVKPYGGRVDHRDQYENVDSPVKEYRISSEKYDPSIRAARLRSRAVLVEEELNRTERLISFFNKMVVDVSPRKGDMTRKGQQTPEQEIAQRHSGNIDTRAVGETTI